MAVDIPDYTQAVNVTGGSVAISGVASVSISGTPNVSIANVPAVTVNSGTISIGNTPSVSISGTPTVILGGGVASIGSISAISSTVTVAGTINIGNTPAVTISGTPNVNIASGTVSISGTPNINIAAQSVNLSTQQPQTSLGSFIVPVNGSNLTATYALPAGTHSVGILIQGTAGAGATGLTQLRITGHITGIDYFNRSASGGNNLTGYFAVAVLSGVDTSIDVVGTTLAGQGPTTVYAVAILDAEAVFVFDNMNEPASVTITDPNGVKLGASGFSGGQQISAYSMPVVLANDQTVPVRYFARTYQGSIVLTCATAATDILTLSGSAGKIVKLRRVLIWGIQTTGAAILLSLVVRSAADTGGTFAALTPYPIAGAGAAVTTWTVNPAVIGALVAQVRGGRLIVPTAPTSGVFDRLEWEFGTRGGEPPSIAAQQFFAINLNASNGAGTVLGIEIEWSEELT